MNVLYLSYDGMTDPLGQSQVIPYLVGLSAAGYKITLVSFEKKERYVTQKDFISELLKNNSINWAPLSYSKKPPVLSTLWDIRKLRIKTRELFKEKQYQIIHCRSYITSIVGLELKRKYNCRFIFDMRGFWADERIEGNLWNLQNPFYKIIYNYFKKLEKTFLKHADQVITLTENAKQIIESWKPNAETPVPIQVIPCCADLDHFSPMNVREEKKLHWKNKLGIKDDDFVVGYLGAIGTWYMLDEMLDFFKCLLERRPESKFLFITQENSSTIIEFVNRKQIPFDKIMVTPSSRNDLPSLLSLLKFSVFFIRPTFSKKASSPTKQGEIMGMGIPVICNSGIGDTDKIIETSRAGLIITGFSRNDYLKAIDGINSILQTDPAIIRKGAEKFYALKSGIEKYKKIYEKLTLSQSTRESKNIGSPAT